MEQVTLASSHVEVGQSCPGHLTEQFFFLAYFRICWNKSFAGNQIHHLDSGMQTSQPTCKTRRNLTCDPSKTLFSSYSPSLPPASFAFKSTGFEYRM